MVVPALLALAAGAAGQQQVGDTTITTSGLKYLFTQRGQGPAPEPGDFMIIHGIGIHVDGTEFWNTRTDGAPWEYTPGIDRVIAGTEEVMKSVREGDRVIVVMKPELAYGDRDRAGIPPNSTLIFDYEVMKVAKRTVARVLREGLESGTVDEAIARARALPDLADHFANPGSILAVARSVGREAPAEGEKILAFGLTLLPDSYALHDALGRAEAQRGAVQDAIRSYEEALRLNPRATNAERNAHERATNALAELKGG
jgi:hypothetical protein